jgi:hypothetical protein
VGPGRFFSTAGIHCAGLVNNDSITEALAALGFAGFGLGESCISFFESGWGPHEQRLAA